MKARYRNGLTVSLSSSKTFIFDDPDIVGGAGPGGPVGLWGSLSTIRST